MKAWEEFLLRLEGELGTDTVKKWLRSLSVVKFDACNLFLEAKDTFQALWFEEHVRERVLKDFVNNNHKRIRVHLAIANKSSASLKKLAHQSPPATPLFQIQFGALDPYCTFANFIEEESNSLTLKVLQDDPLQFNPILLAGESGSGKTHLLMACAQKLKESGKKTIYVRAENFTEHVVSAIRSGEMRRFREAYRNADALLIDDIHFFSRKGATQEELFHTFNTLHLEGKNLIFSANCLPQALVEIEPRLISRFEWGIVLPMRKADNLEKVLMKKAENLHYPLHSKIANFLLESFKSGPKALIRALEALILRSHVNKTDHHALYRPMTVELAKHYLADLLLLEHQAALTPQKIIQFCSEHYGIRPEDILSKAQTRECSEPRQVAMYLCRKDLKLPFTKIGEIFGRDHSTVMSSVRQTEKGIQERNASLLNALAAIEKKGSTRYTQTN